MLSHAAMQVCVGAPSVTIDPKAIQQNNLKPNVISATGIIELAVPVRANRQSETYRQRGGF